MDLTWRLLAESLLFYGHVNLVVNSGHLKTLLRVCGYEVIRDLMNFNVISLALPRQQRGC